MKIIAEKLCSICGLPGEFSPDKRATDGLQSNCKVCRRVINKKYRKTRKEKIKKYQEEYKANNPSFLKDWIKKNPKRRSEIQKKSRLAHPDTKKKWSLLHQEKIRENNKKWKSENPEKRRISQRISVSKRRALKESANACAREDMILLRLIYLNCPEGYQVDHIIPLSKGGEHHPNNLQYLPALINMQKSARLDFDYSKYAINWQSLLDENHSKENVT